MTSPNIDALYAGFADSLPAGLRTLARTLPYVLKLAPAPTIGFGEVFSHEVTLGAPALVAEGFTRLEPELIRRATLAHALSVIEAFGYDRVADQQVEGTSDLLLLFEYLRAARNAALESVSSGASRNGLLADIRTRTAIAQEREMLKRASPVQMQDYDSISLGKQAVGFPAAIALAKAAGADTRQVAHVESALTGVWLGLQAEDDVIDWEDDWRHGGAWAVCLALAGSRPWEARAAATTPELIVSSVLDSGVLRRLLERARRRYRAAWRHGQAIGAVRLSEWAKRREARLNGLVALEARHAGYAVRSRKLASWAIEVLA